MLVNLPGLILSANGIPVYMGATSGMLASSLVAAGLLIVVALFFACAAVPKHVPSRVVGMSALRRHLHASMS